MTLLGVVLLAAVTFGICWLFDKGFVSAFRNKVQHRSGLAVRVNKRYAVFGLILSVLGIATILAGTSDTALLIAGGIFVLLVGIALILYYMTFGIFYDDDAFIHASFGRKSVTYRYSDILSQQLYNTSGSILIELHLKNGKTLAVQDKMEGVYPFLDHAFAAWCRQTGRKAEDCPFHDPDNSCWFPNMEDT